MQPPAAPRDLDSRLIVGREISPMAVEQYRRLAATLHDLQAAKGLKTLLVTSAVPREGKTLTVANLALTLSEEYRRRVVLIDADLRRPALNRVLGIPNRKGLSEAIHAPNGGVPLVQVSSSLSVLTAGKSSAPPVGGLASEAMRALLTECARRFDWVLLDAPPVLLLPDAGLLATLVDGVVLVIGAGLSPWPMVERAVAELGRERIVGTLLNRVEDGAISATDYYDHYYRRTGRESVVGAGED
jgi:capsular exopolysaccharide synthesis family protein